MCGPVSKKVPSPAWKPVSVVPVDQFPCTDHVEAVMIFEKDADAPKGPDRDDQAKLARRAFAAATTDFSAYEIESAGGAVTADAVDVAFDASSDRRSAPGDGPLIEEHWARLTQANPKLYNATKFRFGGATVAGGRVALKLGLTDYKTFQGTNLEAKWAVTLQSGDARLADVLGNAVVVETADGFVPFLRRSATVGEGQGMWAFAGGHPEPADAGAGAHGAAVDCAAIRAELFAAAAKEVSEETGIPPEALSAPLLLGTAVRVVNHRPVLAFAATTTLTRAEVVDKYASAKDKFESTAVEFVAAKDLVDGAAQPPGPLPGDHAGSLALWVAWKKGQRQV